MIDTSPIPILDVMNQLACIRWEKPVRSHGELVYKGGPCPFCHAGTNRFAVFVEGEKPHFYCGIHGNGCKESGDVIKFVQLIKGYQNPREAMRDLRAMHYEAGNGSVATYSPSLVEKGAPPAVWQKMGTLFVHEAEKCLWSPAGKKLLDYLHSRGLTDETIRRYRIGFASEWKEFSLEQWGLTNDIEKKINKGLSLVNADRPTFWIRPGIIIPTFEKDTLWKINIRILEYTPKELGRAKETGEELPRYRQVKGSSNSLFNVDAIQPGQPAFLTEGEFDAMIGQQETGLPFVATGSTSGSQTAHWMARLSLASHLVIAFDDDGGKGEKAAEYWTDHFEDNAMFYPPWSKDVNEMLLQGQDIRRWATTAINFVTATPEETERDTIELSPDAQEHDTPEHPDTSNMAAPTQQNAHPGEQTVCCECGEAGTRRVDGLVFCTECFFAYEFEKIPATEGDKALLALLEKQFSNPYGHEMHSLFTNGEMLANMHKNVYGPFNDRWGLRWFRNAANQLLWNGSPFRKEVSCRDRGFLHQ